MVAMADKITKRYTTEQELDLIRRAQNGDANARDDLLTAYTPMIRGAVAKYIGYHARDFDDFVQDGLLAVNHQIDTFDFSKVTAPRTHLAARLYHQVVDSIRNVHGRRGQKTAMVNAKMLSSLEDEHGRLDSLLGCCEPEESKASRLPRILETLPAKQREMAALYLQNYTMNEIGLLLGISESRVSQMFTDMKLYLKKVLEN